MIMQACISCPSFIRPAPFLVFHSQLPFHFQPSRFEMMRKKVALQGKYLKIKTERGFLAKECANDISNIEGEVEVPKSINTPQNRVYF
jgi:hypothetical protein